MVFVIENRTKERQRDNDKQRLRRKDRPEEHP